MSVALRRPSLRALLAAAAASVALAPAAAHAAPLPVTGVATAVAPDAGLVEGLTALGASVKLSGAATTDEAGRFVFPVTGGALTPELAGKVSHTGGIEFRSRAGIRFGIRQFVIDTTKAPVLTAVPTVGGAPLGLRVPVASIADLQAAAAGDGSATVVRGTLKLTDIGALYINLFLGKAVVKKGTVFGTADATVTLGASGS